jgi:hypothetical protein
MDGRKTYVFISSFTGFLLELMFPSKPVIGYWMLRRKMGNITREASSVTHSFSLTVAAISERI